MSRCYDDVSDLSKTVKWMNSILVLSSGLHSMLCQPECASRFALCHAASSDLTQLQQLCRSSDVSLDVGSYL